MACDAAGSIDLCPTKDEILPQLIANMPRGRAWGRHDGGPFPGTVLYQFLAGCASALAYLNERICALRSEFWCATQRETNDQWMQQYGFPDNCDPYPNLCAKVAAVGGTTCAYYKQVAALAGWDIDCVVRGGQCGFSVGKFSGRSKPGFIKPGRRAYSQITILVHGATSPAYVAGPRTPSKAGRLRAGRPLSCPPDLTGLVCVLERIVHAEALITYEVV